MTEISTFIMLGVAVITNPLNRFILDAANVSFPHENRLTPCRIGIVSVERRTLMDIQTIDQQDAQLQEQLQQNPGSAIVGHSLTLGVTGQ